METYRRSLGVIFALPSHALFGDQGGIDHGASTSPHRSAIHCALTFPTKTNKLQL